MNEMNVLIRAERKLAFRLLLLGCAVFAPLVGGLFFGVDGFLATAFGIPSAAICISAIRGGGGSARNKKSWPHSR